MAGELGAAFARAGARVNPEGEVSARAGLFLFLNFPEDYHTFSRWARLGPDGLACPGTALIHFFVDHPLALPASIMNQLCKLPHYRLLMPCADDTHLLRLRWPTIKHLRCWHGAPPSALCDAAGLERGHAAAPEQGGRDIDLLVAGSIHTTEELIRLRNAIPVGVRGAADEMVRFMLAAPHAAFGQAFELCAPSGVYGSDQWQYLQILWRYVTAALNRERRGRLVRAMQGVRTVVIGTEAWREFCTGTIEYRGEASYERLPGWFSRARTCLAWGPTQFVHSFSERLLLALAGGCACAADDRALVRAEFSSCVDLFDAASPESARASVERLLADRALAAAMGARGRSLVETRHLWDHRLEVFGAAMNDGLRTTIAHAA